VVAVSPKDNGGTDNGGRAVPALRAFLRRNQDLEFALGDDSMGRVSLRQAPIAVLIDHSNPARGDSKPPRDLLAGNSPLTHLDDLCVTLTSGRHGAKTPAQRAECLR